jgi:hypothetical protein
MHTLKPLNRLLLNIDFINSKNAPLTSIVHLWQYYRKTAFLKISSYPFEITSFTNADGYGPFLSFCFLKRNPISPQMLNIVCFLMICSYGLKIAILSFYCL